MRIFNSRLAKTTYCRSNILTKDKKIQKQKKILPREVVGRIVAILEGQPRIGLRICGEPRIRRHLRRIRRQSRIGRHLRSVRRQARIRRHLRRIGCGQPRIRRHLRRVGNRTGIRRHLGVFCRRRRFLRSVGRRQGMPHWSSGGGSGRWMNGRIQRRWRRWLRNSGGRKSGGGGRWRRHMRSGAHIGEDRTGGWRHVHGGGEEGGGGGVGGVVGGGGGRGGGEHRELRLLHPPKQGFKVSSHRPNNYIKFMYLYSSVNDLTTWRSRPEKNSLILYMFI